MSARWFWTDEGMEPNENGEYVLAVSYARIEVELAELEKQLQFARENPTPNGRFDTWQAACGKARREVAERDAELAALRAENAHLKRALALTDALRNKERNLPL